MKKIILSCLATVGFMSLSSCESIDDDHDHRGSTTTTTTEETTLSSRPLSSTVETRTIQSY